MTREPFWYLATPYSGYPDGIVAAFEEASRVAARLIGRGMRIYCPIAHTHPMAVYGFLDPKDHDIWLALDGPFMDAAVGLIVVKMTEWTKSKGIAEEIKRFREVKKPVLYMEWEDAVHQTAGPSTDSD